MDRYSKKLDGTYVKDPAGSYVLQENGTYTTSPAPAAKPGVATAAAVAIKRTGRVTLVGGNTDGKNLFLEVSVFDGEHNNLLKPVFPFNTKAEAVLAYMQEIIETNPKFPDDLSSMMQKTFFWDVEEEAYYTQVGNAKAVRVKPVKK